MKKIVIACLSVFLMVCVINMKSEVQAEEKWPKKPISLIVPLDAGGGLDVTIRPFCQNLGNILGKPVVIVNKPGAGSTIGYRAVHDAKPDGYTIGAGMTTLVAAKLIGLLPYDYHEYTLMGTFQGPNPVLVASTRSKRTFKTVQELIAFAKAHPGEVSMAAGGVGQGWWNLTKDLETSVGIKFNIIPQVGSGGRSIVQVAGGHVEVGVLSLAEGRPQVEAGNIRVLAILVPGGREKRIPWYPDVPAINELGYNVRYSSFAFIMGPKGIPQDITDKIVKAVKEAGSEPEYAKFLRTKSFANVFYWDPEETFRQVEIQRVVFRKIFGDAGLLKEK